MGYTYDYKDREFYERVWDLLVEEGGASKALYAKKDFVDSYCWVEHTTIEHRFGGVFGMGGKFWRNSGAPCGFYVSYYREDHTKKLDKILDKINERIAELVEQYKPDAR